MNDILALLQSIQPHLSKTTLRQLSRVIFGMLGMTGRVTMLGISRWAGQGGSYRTVQRLYHTLIPWAEVIWALFRQHLWHAEDEYILAGDEVVVSKAGNETFGLDRVFSSLFQRAIPGLAFFAFSLIHVRERRSYPIKVEQVVRSEAEKAACKAKAQIRKKKKSTGKRKKGRPKGSKNKDKQQVVLNPELQRIRSMLQALLKLIGGLIPLKYLAMDGHFGNYPSAWKVRQSGLHLISKLRHDAGLYLPYRGPYKGRGPYRKYGDKIDYDHLPGDCHKQTATEDGIRTDIYQAKIWNKEFAELLNVVIIHKTNLATLACAHVVLFSTDLELPFDKLIDYYCLRFQIEIVFTQMTKKGALAGRTGRDHIADLNCIILDNDPVNEQFNQFSFLLEIRILQPDLDPATEILDRSGQAGEFILPVYLLEKLLFQVFQALTFAIQISSSALVFRQRDDPIQISFGEPVQLGLKSNLSTAQVFASRLQLLREPVTPLRSLQSRGNDFGMGQHLTQIIPDQFIQLVGWDITSQTTMVEMGIDRIRLSPTDIIGIARVQLARGAAEVASPTAHQTSQEVFVGCVVAAGKLLVVGQLGLDLLKLLQLHDGRNIGHRDPFFCGDRRMTPIGSAHGMGGRSAPARLNHAGTPYVNSASIRGIGQDGSCGGCVPVFATLGGRDAHFKQMFDPSVEGSVFLQIIGKHSPHHRRFRFVDRDLGRISGAIWINLKPIHRLGPGQQNPSSIFRLTPSAHSVSNQGPFVFGHCPTDLQHQLVMGILTDWTIQKLDLTTIFHPFFQQHQLVNIIPGQTIRRSDHKAVNLPSRDLISQPIQTRPVEASATMTIISKDVLARQLPSLLADITHQPFQLLFDRLGLRLTQGRDPRINRYSHVAPPDSFGSVSLRPSELSPARRERLGPTGSVRSGIPVLPVGFSTGVSWLPPHSDSSEAEYTFCPVAEMRNRNGRRQWFSRN
jgi:hypothetical protein